MKIQIIAIVATLAVAPSLAADTPNVKRNLRNGNGNGGSTGRGTKCDSNGIIGDRVSKRNGNGDNGNSGNKENDNCNTERPGVGNNGNGNGNGNAGKPGNNGNGNSNGGGGRPNGNGNTVRPGNFTATNTTTNITNVLAGGGRPISFEEEKEESWNNNVNATESKGKLDYDAVPSQSSDDSRSEDVALIAEANGWTLYDTDIYMSLQDAFRELVSKMKDDNRFAESTMPESPGLPFKLAFKNGVPPYFEDAIVDFEEQNEVLVEVVSTRFSRKDQQNRAKRIKNKLRAKGFGDMTIAIVGEAIKVSGQKPKNDNSIKPTEPGRDEIRPGQDVDEVAATILDEGQESDELYGVQLDIYEETEEMGTFEHTRGGRQIYSSGAGTSCTTSFSVRQKSTGITGVLSAGHCGASMNMYDAEDSGLHNAPEADYSLTHRETYMGTYGDFAWYTTPHLELPQYWASPTSLRDVSGWDYTPSVNEQVCNYSRMQGKRTCTRIYSNSVDVDIGALPPFENHVAVLSHVTTNGDSGGPWSWGTTAYGVHSGATVIDGVQRSIYSEMYFLGNPDVFGGDIEVRCNGVCNVKFSSQ